VDSTPKKEILWIYIFVCIMHVCRPYELNYLIKQLCMIFITSLMKEKGNVELSIF